MRHPNLSEWRIAEVLMEPQELFVIWAVNKGFCTSIEDFQRHYGPALPIDALIATLEERGFVRFDSNKITLTKIGREVIAALKPAKEAPYKEPKSAPEFEVPTYRGNPTAPKAEMRREVSPEPQIRKQPVEPESVKPRQRTSRRAVFVLVPMLAAAIIGAIIYMVHQRHLPKQRENIAHNENKPQAPPPIVTAREIPIPISEAIEKISKFPADISQMAVDPAYQKAETDQWRDTLAPDERERVKLVEAQKKLRNRVSTGEYAQLATNWNADGTRMWGEKPKSARVSSVRSSRLLGWNLNAHKDDAALLSVVPSIENKPVIRVNSVTIKPVVEPHSWGEKVKVQHFLVTASVTNLRGERVKVKLHRGDIIEIESTVHAGMPFQCLIITEGRDVTLPAYKTDSIKDAPALCLNYSLRTPYGAGFITMYQIKDQSVITQKKPWKELQQELWKKRRDITGEPVPKG